MWPLLKLGITRHPLAVLALFFLGLGIAGFEGIGLGLLLPIIEGLDSPNNIQPTHPVSQVIEDAMGLVGLPFSLWALFVTGLTIFLLQSLMQYARTVLVALTRVRIEMDIRTQLFASLLRTRIGYFHLKQIGELSNNIVLETTRAGAAFQNLLMAIITATLVVAYMVIMSLISWQLSLLTLGFVAMFGLIGRKRDTVRRRGQAITQANSALQSTTFEYFSGVREVKALGMEQHANESFHEVAGAVTRQNFLFDRLVARFRFLYEVTAVVVTLGLVGLGVFWLRLEVASLTAFLVIVFRLTPRLILLQDSVNKYLGSEPGYAAVRRLMAEADEHRMPTAATTAGRVTLQSSIDFEDVRFSYGDGAYALDGVTLSLPRGAMTAIVGASGAGKSTLADLLLRFSDPTEGRIVVDGTDLRMIDAGAWRSTIGFVSQDTFLFHDTVLNNIRFGNPRASRSRIEEAAERAGAHEFVLQLKDGYETVLGDRGVTLSGGQRQRISLARALVRDPQILVLDEATSDLDAESQYRIRESIKAMSGTCTVVVIAHRLSTAQHADTIVVLEQGRVVETGYHEALLEKNGHYARYYHLEFAGPPSAGGPSPV